MAEIMNPVTVMFGTAKNKKKASKAPKLAVHQTSLLAPPLAPPYKEPSHEERLHNAAADEHVNAARDYVAGRISSKQFGERKARAAKIMAKTPKNTK